MLPQKDILSRLVEVTVSPNFLETEKVKMPPCRASKPQQVHATPAESGGHLAGSKYNSISRQMSRAAKARDLRTY